MINWTKDNHIEWISISDKLVKEYKRNEKKTKTKRKSSSLKKKRKKIKIDLRAEELHSGQVQLVKR